MSNCDDFIFYDDLVREEQKSQQRKKRPAKKAAAKSERGKRGGKAEDKAEDNKLDEAVALIMETAEALYADQGDSQKLWGSMVKQALKRRRPGFNERFYGARSFSDLLEEAQNRGLVTLELDERSGGYVITSLTADK